MADPTQKDRDAAADWIAASAQVVSNEATIAAVRRGAYRHGDYATLVQAFARHRLAERERLVNTPETADFMAGVPLEAKHQRERWGSDHDAGKTPFDWFWLVGYLAQKAASSAGAGDLTKAQHHTISTAAALANWHAALTGADTSMRPGIDPTTIRSSSDAE